MSSGSLPSSSSSSVSGSGSVLASGSGSGAGAPAAVEFFDFPSFLKGDWKRTMEFRELGGSFQHLRTSNIVIQVGVVIPHGRSLTLPVPYYANGSVCRRRLARKHCRETPVHVWCWGKGMRDRMFE